MIKRVLIIGAGVAGQMVLNEIINHKRINQSYKIIGLLDDNKVGIKIDGYEVLGNIASAKTIIQQQKINEVIIAIPSGSKELISEIVDNVGSTGIKIKIVPGIFEIISGKITWNQIREVRPEDLLGREEVDFEIDKINHKYKNKIVLVTGAGGSIGSEIVRNLLKLDIKKIIALGHGENSIHSLLEEFRSDKRFDYIIGDIKDTEKIEYILKNNSIDFIFHAAAHKHLPLMEEYPDEALKNNIFGTYNVAKAAIKYKIPRFILISTDKAVNPTSVMGATKAVAERIIISMNGLQKETRFSLVRFGNVLGSRGSVIPAFKKQIEKGGPVLITHKDIERYFMSIPEAAKLVIKSSVLTDVNIAILDMGRPIKIIELAKNLIKLSGYTEDEIPIEIVGLRKGEKLFEELTIKDTLLKSEFDKILIATENLAIFKSENEIEKMIAECLNVARTFNRGVIVKFLKGILSDYLGEKN